VVTSLSTEHRKKRESDKTLCSTNLNTGSNTEEIRDNRQQTVGKWVSGVHKTGKRAAKVTHCRPTSFSFVQSLRFSWCVNAL